MDNKIAVLLAAFFILGNTTFAQGWETTIPSDSIFGGPGLTMGLKVTQTANGDYLLAGGVSYPTGAVRDYARLAKTDADGNILWQHTYGDGDVKQEYISYLDELPTGNIILAGTNFNFPFVKMVDNEGELIWDTTFQNNGTVYTSQYGIEYSDDSFILMGHTSMSFVGTLNLFFMKIDHDGNLLWEKNHPTTSTGIPSAIALTSDGGFVIVGTLDSQLSLSKFKSNGDFEWGQAYQVSDQDRGLVVNTTPDNGFLIGGSTHGLDNNFFPVMIKTDSMGAAEWVKITNNLSGGITAMKPTPDGGFIATGAIKEFWGFSTDGFILKTNATGEEEWSENLSLENKQFADIKLTDDGGYILGGRSGDAMLLKKIGGTTSAKNIFNSQSIKVFPNPMSDQTLFKFNDNNLKTKHLQIFDSKGSLVFEKTISDNSFIFYSKNYSNGIYFYQIKQEGNIIGKGKIMMNY